MITKENSKNIRVGIFVIAATVVLIFTLYIIGAKQNLFGSTFRLRAQFHNVNGLMSGNNVRFTGIDIGTVEKVEIINDSTVNVIMVVENKVQQFIKKNATAIVGSDGLMGNKLINITSVTENADFVEDDDVLKTLTPIGTDEMMKTLYVTNLNVKDISFEVKSIVQKLNKPNSLWNILMDTVIAQNLKHAILQVKITSENLANTSTEINEMISSVKSGKGSLGVLIKDDAIAHNLHESIINIKHLSDSLNAITNDLHSISSEIKNGNGLIGKLMKDTAWTNNVNATLINTKNASKKFDENLDALKHNFLLRRYFKISKSN
jgi:phospholipid/cholesterol/gamma-HCH transport system substrate-binding protein